MTRRTEPIRILELRSVFGTGGGPEKTILVGTANTDPAKFRITVCYLRDNRDTAFEIDVRAASLGIDYLELREQHSFDPHLWFQLVQLVRDRRIQLVHAHDYKSDLLAWLLALQTHIIPMATVHGWSGNTRRERLYYRADKWLLARFPAVIAVSGVIREELLRWGSHPGRVWHVPNGVDTAFYQRVENLREKMRAQLCIRPNEIVIGSVGRLEHEKRLDVLLSAAAMLPFGVRVLIVGDGSCRPSLLAQANDLGIADRVLVTGRRNDVRDLFHAFDVYVQTSDTEGIPNVLLEAMATEVPIVATNVGGTSELVRHSEDAILVRAGDVSGIAAAIQQVVANPFDAGVRVRFARSRVEDNFSFAARMAKVEVLYEALAAESNHTCGPPHETRA